MKLSKIEGLKMLEILDIPTVKLIDANLLDENSQVLKQGLSVRVSPKSDTQNNVYLPSIHNCTDLNQIREFIKQYQKDYYIIVHKTVNPELLGSVSRYQMSPESENLIIELFKDFGDRKIGKVKNRVILPIYGDKFMASELQMAEENKEDFFTCSKVIREVKTMPFKTYDAEFVLEDGRVNFTDLTIQSPVDSYLMEQVKGKSKELETIR